MSDDLTEAVDVLYDWLWGPDDPQPRESCADVIGRIAPIIERQVREEIAKAIERQQFQVESAHQFHNHTCLCGFSSARSRSRTEHITAVLDAAHIARGGAR